jgi:hypothetical protein
VRKDENMRDKNGRLVMEGDIIKVFHFIAPHKRKVYMYKKIFSFQGKLQAVCLHDFGDKPLNEAHKCNLSACGDFEIIDGLPIFSDIGAVEWWERKKVADKSEPF